MQNSIRKIYIVLFLLLILSAAASLCLGSGSVGAVQIVELAQGQGSELAQRVFRYVRVPRTVAALLAGAALALSGTVLQGTLGNPLAAPNIVGINAGAGLGVVLAGAFAPAAAGVQPLAAFAGAVCAALLVLTLAQATGASRVTVVLAGVAISAILTAGIETVLTFYPDALSGYAQFRLGGFSGVSMAKIFPAGWLILAVMLCIFLLSGQLDVLLLGEDTARSLGQNTRLVRCVLLVLAAALAGAAVSFSGLIGFVGLIVPHILRRLVGEESGILLPASALGGAVLLTLCDTAARVIFAPYELPVGILLSLGGGPFFLWLLLRRKGGTHA